MTKQEWKKELAKLLNNEPEIGDKQKFETELINYLDMLEHKGNDYYGIRHEIIIAIESYLEL